MTSALLEALDRHASTRPDQIALRHLPEGELDRGAEELGYAALRDRALGVAASLQGRIEPGARALLLYDGGLDFIVSLLGCFYAGVIAVPTFPPDPARLQRTLPRLRSISADAGATLVLTTRGMQAVAEPLCRDIEGLGALGWLPTDGLDDDAGTRFEPRPIPPEHTSYLQYTSGATGTPKGVDVPHGSLDAICRDWLDCWPYDERTHQVTWLPTFHDLGLIRGLLTPLLGGIPCTFMPPVAFIRRPARWLEVITRLGGTTTASPNFGFELCIREVRSAELSGLDLSSLVACMNAAEPVRAHTMRAFTERFAPVGFDPRAWCPCYGLAEATLQISVSRPELDSRAGPTVLPVSADALARDRVELLPEDAEDDWAEAIGNGPVIDALELAIVDPRTQLRTEGIGEIWAQGDTLARGYWGRPDESEATFGARLEDEPGVWLRTGDLGFVHQGELFVTGRLKDLIIVRGRNLYPQDLELAAEQTHRAVRSGCVAAFPLDLGGAERIGIVAEIDPRCLDGTPPDGLITPIRRAIAEQFDVAVHAVALVGPRNLPKTSSGKLQRRRAALWLREQSYETVHASFEAELGPDVDVPRGGLAIALSEAPEARHPTLVVDWLRHQIGALLDRPDASLPADRAFTDLGVDSVRAVDLVNQLATALDTELPTTTVFDYTSMDALAAHVLHLRRPEQPAGPDPASVVEMTEADAQAALLDELDDLGL